MPQEKKKKKKKEPFYDDYFGTFCIYCQQDYASEAVLMRHVLKEHPNTYASHAVQQIQERRKDNATRREERT